MSLIRGEISSTSGATLAHSDGISAHLLPNERYFPPNERRFGAIITDIAPKYRWRTRNHRSFPRDLRSFGREYREIPRE